MQDKPQKGRDPIVVKSFAQRKYMYIWDIHHCMVSGLYCHCSLIRI